MRHAALPFVTSPYSPLRSMRSDQRSEHGSDFSSVVSQSKLHDRTRSMSMASDTDSEIVPIETQIPNSNGIAFDHRDSPFLHPNYHRTSLSRGDIPLTLSIDVDMENDQNTVGTSLTSASSMLLPPVRSLRRKLVPKRIRKAASRVLRLVHVTNKSKDMTDSGSDSVRAMTL